MCKEKDEAKTKVDRLIEAIDRLSSLLEKIGQDAPAQDPTSRNGIRAGCGMSSI